MDIVIQIVCTNIGIINIGKLMCLAFVFENVVYLSEDSVTACNSCNKNRRNKNILNPLCTAFLNNVNYVVGNYFWRNVSLLSSPHIVAASVDDYVAWFEFEEDVAVMMQVL